MTEEMVVWCDAASHPVKRPRIFVNAFVRTPDGWLVADNKRRRTKGAAAEWLRDDALMGPVEPDGNHHGVDNVGGHDDMDRVRVRLRCRRCKRPLIARTGKFDAALDQLADAGREYATLSEIRGILKKSGELF